MEQVSKKKNGKDTEDISVGNVKGRKRFLTPLNKKKKEPRRIITMNKITKGDARAFYTKMKREERKKMVANILLLLPVVGILFWLVGCSTQQPTTVIEKETTNDKLQQEWNDIYASVKPQVHPPRNYGHVLDTEVFKLSSKLNEYGISVFRIDPNNPEHQRRYRRHLDEPHNFYGVVEEDI